MKAAPASMGVLLAAPWRWQLNQHQPVMLWSGALLLGVLLGVLVAFKGWLVGLFASGAAAAGLAIAAWMLTLAGLRRQNHPHLARLVPGHVRRLRLAVLVLWGLPVLAVGLAARWMASDPWAALLLTALGLSLMTTFLRWPTSFVLVWFLPPTLVPLWQRLPLTRGLTEAWMSVWQLGPQWLCLPIIGVLAWFQMDLIGHGDEAHARRYRRLERLLASLQQSGNPRYQGRWGLRVNWLFAALQRGYMARLVRQPKPTVRHRLARLELPLYGSAHWTMVLGSVFGVLPFVVVGFGLLALAVPEMSAGLRELPVHWVALIAGQLCMGVVVGMLCNVDAALQRSRREQALLTLLPGVPQQGPLRAALLRRQGLQLLCLGLPGLLLINATGSPHPVPFLMGLGVGTLPASLLLLRDWAQRRAASPILPIGLTLAVAVLWSQFVPAQAGAWDRLGLIAMLLVPALCVWVWALRRFERLAAAPLPFGRRAP